MKVLTEFWDFFKKNFAFLAILIIFLVMYFSGCFERFKPVQPTVTVVHDTAYIYHDTVIYSKPTVINSIPPKPKEIPPTMLPDTNYYKLKAQYEDLLTKHYTKNIQTDTQKVDSIGSVTVTDTTQQNKIIGRKWDINIKERVVTTTITKTIPEEKRNQWFAGIGVETLLNTGVIRQVELGLQFKNKKNDDIIGIAPVYDFSAKQFGARATYYKLITFKRK